VVSSLGGQENAFTSFDYTAYFQRVAKEHLGTMMEFEADRMTGLMLADEVVAPERDVVLEERRMRVETDPSPSSPRPWPPRSSCTIPYGIPIIGWMHEIEGLNREHALDYYRRFYTPENAILVVAGDVTPDEVRRLADRTYGAIAPAGERPQRVRPREPQPQAARSVCVADPKVEQPTLQRLYLTPSCRTAPDRDGYALELLAEVLGGGATSHFYRKLVMERGLAGERGRLVHGHRHRRHPLLGLRRARGGRVAGGLEAAVDETIRTIADDALSPEAIERAKNRLVAETVYASDSQSSLARIYGSALAIGESIEDVRRWPGEIESLTKADLAGVAERYLLPRRSVTGLLRKAS
jgi:zinc protease